MGDPPAASSSRRTRHAKPHCPTPDYWQPKTLFRARPRSPVSRLGYLPRHPFQGPGWAWHQSAALLRIPSIGDPFSEQSVGCFAQLFGFFPCFSPVAGPAAAQRNTH